MHPSPNPQPSTYQSLLKQALETYQKGDFAEAAKHYEALATLETPKQLDILNMLGACYIKLKQYPKALAEFQKIIALKPNHPEALFNLGQLYMKQKRFADSIQYFKKLWQQEPQNITTLDRLFSACYFSAEPEETRVYGEQLLALKPNDNLKIILATLLPHIIPSKAAIPAIRKAYEERLDALLKEGSLMLDPKGLVSRSSFYLAYHGLNDLDLQKKLARIFQKALPPALQITAPHCINYQPPKNRPIRIGFISNNFNFHSVGHSYNQLIAELAEDKAFEVILFSLCEENAKDETLKKMSQVGSAFIELNQDIEEAVKRISAERCDILIYTDIGMVPITYILPFSRLAPVQAVMGGHPVTTGIPTMDYFITSKLIEPKNAQEHYSEKLLYINPLLLLTPKPQKPQKPKNRKELGLPEKGHLYICPMKLQKLHPDFDSALAELLSQDPEGIVVFFEDDRNPTWKNELLKRFSSTIAPALHSRIIFLPFAPVGVFYHILLAADVVLDSFHFGAGTTSYMVLAMGKPLLTLPGAYLRGRSTLALYKTIGVMDLVASSPKEYVALAVKLGTDSEFRKKIEKKIADHINLFFADRGVAKDFANALKSLIEHI